VALSAAALDRSLAVNRAAVPGRSTRSVRRSGYTATGAGSGGGGAGIVSIAAARRRSSLTIGQLPNSAASDAGLSAAAALTG